MNHLSHWSFWQFHYSIFHPPLSAWMKQNCKIYVLNYSTRFEISWKNCDFQLFFKSGWITLHQSYIKIPVNPRVDGKYKGSKNSVWIRFWDLKGIWVQKSHCKQFISCAIVILVTLWLIKKQVKVALNKWSCSSRHLISNFKEASRFGILGMCY